ncbi:MAG: GyrI-like domain-containing protein [Ferruginibacter sp.]
MIGATGPGLHRMLLDKSNVSKWWPGTVSNDSFYLNGLAYKINNGNITLLPVSVYGQHIDLTTSLFLISGMNDSTKLVWVGSMVTSYNPIDRFSAFLKAKKINRDMTAILEKIKTFYSKPENIYGFDIKKTLIVDSLLIATSAESKGYPTNQFIYGLVDKLRNYATSNAAKESGYPMLNIVTTDSVNFDVKVALPIDKALPSSGDILPKAMPGKFKILMTEVKGGLDVTSRASEQIQKYSDDHSMKSAAIPFHSLVTDRSKETDPNKWVTKIYFPVLIYN